MGTGIFLSATLDYLAHRLLESIKMNLETSAQDGQACASDSESCEQDGQACAPDLVWARCKIAQNCLYGVDLDEGAVEIARLSIVLQCRDFSPELNAVIRLSVVSLKLDSVVDRCWTQIIGAINSLALKMTTKICSNIFTGICNFLRSLIGITPALMPS